MRYCTKQEDLQYILANQQQIRTLLKKFNSKNEIIYISSTEKEVEIDNIHYIEKDLGDSVARTFFEKAPKLREYLIACSALENDIKYNIKRYRMKKVKKFFKKINEKIRIYFHTKPYYHYQQYEEVLKNERKT